PIIDGQDAEHDFFDLFAQETKHVTVRHEPEFHGDFTHGPRLFRERALQLFELKLGQGSKAIHHLTQPFVFGGSEHTDDIAALKEQATNGGVLHHHELTAPTRLRDEADDVTQPAGARYLPRQAHDGAVVLVTVSVLAGIAQEHDVLR